MKNYVAEIIDLTPDDYLNPAPAIYDNGPHPRALGDITSISVHHDATYRPHNYDSVARYKQEAASHYQRLGPGLQYHYKIDNVGQIFKIRPLDEWLYVVGSAENESTIAICLDGYLHDDYTNQGQDPTREQYEALAQLLEQLCEQHPEFPATWPNVRPHCNFSSTACCGNRLVPFITAINSKADAYNIPAGAVYDWAQEQPAPAPLPEPTPVPTPQPTPAPVITYEALNPAKYVAQVKTHLDDAATGARIADYEPGWEVDMVRIMRLGEKTWLQTKYSVDKYPTRGVPEKDLILKNIGVPIPPSDPAEVPTPPVPEVPPAPKPTDQDHMVDKFTAFQALVRALVSIWLAIKNWRKK